MLIIEANYSKKLGLPGFSSHQYSLTLRAEVADVTQVSAKSQELHRLVQTCVDRELQATGFLPVNNGNGNSNGHARQIKPVSEEAWKCSPKQRELILKLIEENRVEKHVIEKLAQDRFGQGVKQLNKLEASGLIEELFEKYPSGRSK